MSTSLNQIKEKLLSSSAVNSLMLENKVYNLFSKMKWQVWHSPYYLDIISGKNREIDIKASKYWISTKGDNFSCRLEIIVECKSLKDYHIVVSNENKKTQFQLPEGWIGNDSNSHYQKLKEILNQNDLPNKSIKEIIKKVDSYCVPDVTYRNVDYLFDAFEIRAFNTFRETNIANTKDIDNSVIWKCQQSLNSCIKSFENLCWNNVDYSIKSDIYDLELHEILIDKIIKSITEEANYKKVVHPIVVIESNLWELKEGNLETIKYFRLCFQQLFDDEFWIDIVHIDFLEEYLQNIKTYEKTLKSKGLSDNLEDIFK